MTVREKAGTDDCLKVITAGIKKGERRQCCNTDDAQKIITKHSIAHTAPAFKG